MRNSLILFYAVLCLVCNQASAQKIREKRHIDMIIFLINQKQLMNVGDTSNIASYEDYMFDRVILKINHQPKTSTLYIFGSNSPHGKEYIALEDLTGLKMLETKNMPKEIQSILDFYKRNHATNQMILKSLPAIADAYQQNTRTFKPQLEN